MSRMPGDAARRMTDISNNSSFASGLSSSRSIRLLRIKEDDCQVQVERALRSSNIFLYSCEAELRQADNEILDRLLAKIIISKVHTYLGPSPKDVEPALQQPRFDFDGEHLYMISEKLKLGMDPKEVLQVLFKEVYEHGYIMSLLSSRSENTQTDILISILAATTKSAKPRQRTNDLHREGEQPEWEKEVALWESKKAMRRETDEKAKTRIRSVSENDRSNFTGYKAVKEDKPGEKRLFRLPRWPGPWKYERDIEEDDWLLRQMKEKQKSHLLWVYPTAPSQAALSGREPFTRPPSTQENESLIAVEGSVQRRPASYVADTQELGATLGMKLAIQQEPEESVGRALRNRTSSAPPRTGVIHFLSSIAEKPLQERSQKIWPK